MAKNILLLANHYSKRKWAEAQQLGKALRTKGMAATVSDYGQISVLINDTTRRIWLGGDDLTTFDAVYFRNLGQSRGLAATVAAYLQENSIPFIDSEAYTQQSFDKLQQMYILSQHNLPVPTTFFGTWRQLQATISKGDLQFPLIVKGKVSSRGHHNFLANDAKQATAIFNTEPEGFFIVQQNIPNTGDYRIVTLGNKASLVLYRQRQSQATHLNNTSQGAKAQIIDISDTSLIQLLPLAEKATQVLGREVAGVDIVVDAITNKPYILEVNRAPQLAAGATVDLKLAAFVNFLYNL